MSSAGNKPYPFKGWSARDINYVLRSINENVPVDEFSMKLDDAQKELYEEMRAKLAEENKNYDHWIIGYGLMELETE